MAGHFTLLGGLARLVRARAGNVGMILALALPAAATLVLGATDVASIMGDRERMRSIAEAAALAGARNLSVAMSEADATEHAKSMALAMIGEWRNAPHMEVAVSVLRVEHGAKAVHVEIDARRPSFFGDLLPPGGWQYGQEATASSIGTKPLCVLAFSDSKQNKLTMQGAPEIRAPLCLVHSNGDVDVKGGSIDAGQTQAVRSATGNITPDPITDAPPITDPFADLDMSTAGILCLKKNMNIALALMVTGEITLPAGVHCGLIDVGGDAVVNLAPGEHRFVLGSLTMRGQSRLVGDDVVMIFDRTWKTKFKDDALIRLSGRESGTLSGFVLMVERGNTQIFEIDSTHVERLDGVIYAPDAELYVGGTSDVARESDWTVIVANSLSLNGNPHLYLNADYDGSDILAPAGVGNRRDAVRLLD